MNFVDWSRIEQLCRKSFTGRGITEDEHHELESAFQHDRHEYIRRTHAVRSEERERLASF